MAIELHVIGQFASHEEATDAAHALETHFPGGVSLSTSTPHDQWRRPNWFESALAAVGGTAAAVSQLVPGFGVLFMGGPLDGVRQGSVLANWLEAHPEHGEANAHFVIVTVEDLNVKDAKRLLTEQGAKHVHEVLEPESER